MIVKKLFKYLLILIIAHFNIVFSNNFAHSQDQNLNIITINYPIYIFTKNITHTRKYVNVDLLLDPSIGCSHDYSMTVSDKNKLLNADLIIANGLGLDDFINGYPNKVCASNGIKVIDNNPHVFTSPNNAIKIINNIKDALCNIDKIGADAYRKMAQEYTTKLYSIVRRIHLISENAKNKPVILQNSLLSYLIHDAGFQIMDIMSIDEDSNPTPAKLLEIAKHAKENKPLAIITAKGTNTNIAENLAKEINVEIIELDPFIMGKTDDLLSKYEEIMAKNCQKLESILENFKSN